MASTDYLWAPRPMPSLPVRNNAARLPVNRIFCVGRNYHAHAKEMGRPVDKATMRPFYFTKGPGALVESGATVPYPPETKDYQYEMELVLAIGAPGFRVSRADAGKLIWNIAELIEDLTKFYHLVPGDLIFTGTPEGVGPVVAGDRIEGRIDNVGTITLTVGKPE